jgi:hypothetical protein
MLKLNDQISGREYEIGKSTNSNQLCYVSVNKYIIEHEGEKGIRLAQIKCILLYNIYSIL